MTLLAVSWNSFVQEHAASVDALPPPPADFCLSTSASLMALTAIQTVDATNTVPAELVCSLFPIRCVDRFAGTAVPHPRCALGLISFSSRRTTALSDCDGKATTSLEYETNDVRLMP